MKNDLLTTKTHLHQKCVNNIEKRILELKNGLQSLQESKLKETKSSVGDKYETGRAMIQQEENNIKQQLAHALQQKTNLAKFLPIKEHNKVEAGSLVVTNRGQYYVSIGLGKVVLEDEMFFCVSLGSPIGQKLKGLESGDKFMINGGEVEVLVVR